MRITYRLLAKETNEIIELLKNTVWGLNGPLFSHKNVAHRIKSNPKNHFFCAFHHEKLVGIVVCCERKIHLPYPPKKVITGVYTRYFSILKEYRGHKIGETLLENVSLHFQEKFITEPVIFYAYQDKKNTPSMKVADNKKIAVFSDFQTFIFSRISPTQTEEVSLLNLNELVKANPTKENTFHKQTVKGSTVYGLKDKKGELICGARFLPSSWEIVKVPGWQGALMKYVVSRIPYLKRLFNRKSFDFLAVDHLYVSGTCSPKQLSRFLESVLKLNGYYLMLLWSDLKAANYTTIKKIPSPGLLEKINENVPACIRVEHKNLMREEIESLKRNPFFICSADLT